jgi:hypothetical protein
LDGQTQSFGLYSKWYISNISYHDSGYVETITLKRAYFVIKLLGNGTSGQSTTNVIVTMSSPLTEDSKFIDIPYGDSMVPVGTEVEYNGDVEDIPEGWELASNYGTDICKITLQAENQTLTSPSDYGTVKIPLTVYYITTSKLSVSSNQITIGAGVHHIKVSAQVIQDQNSDLGLRGISVRKNNSTELICNYWSAYANNEFHTYSIPESYFDVQEGDVLGLYFYSNNNASTTRIRKYGQSTFLQVEVID